MPIFDEGDRIAYLGFMAEELKRFSVEVLAWCLMTNHAHLIVVPSDARLLARAIGEAHRRYTRMKNFSAGCAATSFRVDSVRVYWTSVICWRLLDRSNLIR
jgi:putative transposase